jgi:dTDP-4-amino-4,6-dideoxygalactose transaminase
VATDTAWSVPLSDVVVDDALVAAVTETVASGWWSMGPRVQQLETAFAAASGASHALAVANGTAALHLALLAIGCGPGDEVVLPSLNFVAAANTVALTGARPVFCDIRGGDDLNLDPADAEDAVGPATKAVLALHYGGFACALDDVRDLAARHGVVVLEDAAHAPGSRHGARWCGTVGAVGCYSFFANKNLPVGEGGMVVTDDDALAERLRLLRSHGMTTLTWDRHRGHASSYDVVLQGLNYRLDEIRAALTLVQLERLETENAGRRRVALRYRDALHDRAGIRLAFADRLGDAAASHHLAVALLPEDVSRDAVRTALADRRIQTSVHYPPIHTFTAYRAGADRPLPRTDAVATRLLTLPLFGHMTNDQVDAVVEGLLDAVGGRAA